MDLNAINSKLRQTFHEGKPWVRYRTLVDLLDREEEAPKVIEAWQTKGRLNQNKPKKKGVKRYAK